MGRVDDTEMNLAKDHERNLQDMPQLVADPADTVSASHQLSAASLTRGEFKSNGVLSFVTLHVNFNLHDYYNETCTQCSMV